MQAPATTDPRESTLLRMRAELRDRLQRLTEDQRRGQGALEADFAEQAVQRENDEVVDGLTDGTWLQLQQVNHALDRMLAGSGNLCERCGSPISPARLAALPQSTRCADCADSQGA